MFRKYSTHEISPSTNIFKKLDPQFKSNSDTSKINAFPKNSLNKEMKCLIDQKVLKMLNFPFHIKLYNDLTPIETDTIILKFPKYEYKSQEAELIPNLQDFYYPKPQEEMINIQNLDIITKNEMKSRTFSTIINRYHLLN